MNNSCFIDGAKEYLSLLGNSFSEDIFEAIEQLAMDLRKIWIERRNVFICGNGGSAANALHIANDLLYGIGATGSGPKLPGLSIEALPANPGVITCLANDTGYENIYSHQLDVKGKKGDLLIALSGSGNSENILRALQKGHDIGMKTYSILAFSGGRCKSVTDVPIHFPVNDMQIAEDTQMIICNMIVKWLIINKPNSLNKR